MFPGLRFLCGRRLHDFAAPGEGEAADERQDLPASLDRAFDGARDLGNPDAAPVAANVILKARELGLLGDKYRAKAPAQTPAPKKRK